MKKQYGRHATHAHATNVSNRDGDTLLLSDCLTRTKTLLFSMLIFHDTIFEQFSLANIEICLCRGHECELYRDRMRERENDIEIERERCIETLCVFV